MKMETHTTETETRFGIKKLDLLLEFLPLTKYESDEKTESDLINFKIFIETKINRPLLDTEFSGFVLTILNFFLSEHETKERTTAINNLTNLEFIK